jgi:hypothetical protein
MATYCKSYSTGLGTTIRLQNLQIHYRKGKSIKPMNMAFRKEKQKEENNASK